MTTQTLAGQELSIGGEGMKQFYDQTYRNALGKLVKPYGVKVGQADLPRASFEADNALLGELGLGKARASDTVYSVDITPEMREDFKNGIPMFAQGGAVTDIFGYNLGGLTCRWARTLARVIMVLPRCKV